MRVGLVSPYSWAVPSGVNENIASLAAQLERDGHDTWIIAPMSQDRHAPSQRPLPEGGFIRVGATLGFRSNGSRANVSAYPFMLQRMDKVLRSVRFDVLHVHEPCAPAVSAAATLRSPYPTVGTFHAALDRSVLYGSLSLLVQRALEHLDVKIAVSEEAARYLRVRYPGTYHIIPNGVDTDAYARGRQVPEVDGRVVFLGRAEPRKGLGVLLRAYELVRDRLPSATLSLAGTKRKEATRLAESFYEFGDLPPGIDALGWVDLDTKIDEIGKAAVLCAPSLEGESFGMVLIEALAAGTPVVASDLPGYRAVLGGGRYGLLVPPNDPQALADALTRVLTDPALRRRLSIAGMAAAERLSWRQLTRSVVAAYEEAIEFSPANALRPRLARAPRKARRAEERARVRA
jgi:phosphatidyl-myo-inositol alpha-mannosyltransferase